MKFKWTVFKSLDDGSLIYQSKLNKTQYLFKTLQDGKWLYWSDVLSLNGFKKYYKPVGDKNDKKN